MGEFLNDSLFNFKDLKEKFIKYNNKRLQNKTQVFPLPGSQMVHNRLTHSLEVASVGRSIARLVSKTLSDKFGSDFLNDIYDIDTIVSSACLAHDLGNPPFGHSGEETISSYFKDGPGKDLESQIPEYQWTDLVSFEGNANAFRQLTHQFAGRRQGGMSLTYATLATLVKYPYPSFNKKGKKKLAVNNLNFEIKQGEAVAFLGRNGAGKSTILKMVTEVAFPTKGEIFVDGRVGALLELSAGFDPEFSGRENIYLKGHILGLQDKEIALLEPAIVEFADLGDYIDQPVRTYSSGMKARLGFSINVNIQPDILIVDEALSVGDEEFRKKCITRVNQLLSDGNITLMFVTHSITVAQAFCTRGIVMNNGQAIFDGPIAEAADQYNALIGKKKK